jgi:hypothetical protein
VRIKVKCKISGQVLMDSATHGQCTCFKIIVTEWFWRVPECNQSIDKLFDLHDLLQVYLSLHIHCIKWISCASSWSRRRKGKLMLPALAGWRWMWNYALNNLVVGIQTYLLNRFCYSYFSFCFWNLKFIICFGYHLVQYKKISFLS